MILSRRTWRCFASRFGLWALRGRSTFLSPWFVHVHAVSFMGWIAIYLARNVLIFRGDTAGIVGWGGSARGGRRGWCWSGWRIPP